MSVNARVVLCVTAFMLLFSVAAKSQPTDQIMVIFDTPEQAKSKANPIALEKIQASLERRIGLKRYAGNGEIAVLKLSEKLDNEKIQAVIAKLSQRFGVTVEADAIMQTALAPNDSFYAEQWHYFDAVGGVNAEPAWDEVNGAGVVVAVLDTGYRPHADLSANILPGYDMIADTFVANDGDGRDSDAQDPGDHILANECGYTHSERRSSWHGTHVAGTIVATTNNASGVAGVAFGAKAVPVRVLGKCGGYTSDIVDGIRWAAGLSVFGVPANANPAQVLNLSLGGRTSCGVAYQNAVNDVVAQGASVVVAAGNSNDDAANYAPANCNNVITVASSNRNTDRAYYSNYGSSVEVAAPGGDSYGYVYSTYNSGYDAPGSDSFAYLQGTSMAAPHVAGVAALLYSKDASLLPSDVLSVLQQTSRAFSATSSCFGLCGTGIVDAASAVAALSTVTEPEPEPEPEPQPQPLVPAVPANLSAAVDASGLVSLSWDDVADETGYEVKREEYKTRGKNKGWTNATIIANTSADVTSINDNLSADGSYRYSVRAVNANGASNWSTTVEVKYQNTSDGGGGGGGGSDKPCRGNKCK